MNDHSERIRAIVHLIISSTYKHRKVLDFHLEKTGVFSSQHQLLMEIARNQHSSQKEIADRLRISTAAVAVSLKKLEKGGYISKEMDSDDNRLNQIALTEKGQEVVAISRHTFRTVDHSIFEDFSEEELTTFHQLLQKLNNKIALKEDEVKLQKERNKQE